MAATAYAFVVSLMNTMDQIHTHPRLSTCFDHSQFQSLSKNLDSLLDFVENHSDTDGSSTDLLSRIATVAQLTEDLIEVEAADQIRDLSTTHKTHSFFLDLQTKIQEMDSIINDEIIMLKQKTPLQDNLLPSSPPPSSTSDPPATATVKKSSGGMVGFDGYVEQLLDELTGYHSARRILPIVGMGGVGKTTLARRVYENRLTVEHFHIRVWITVSQTFTVSDIFTQALSCLGDCTDGRYTTDDELGEKLRKNLYGRRYLVVLDDMWRVEAWERIKFYFPENNSRSRIVVTTRQQQLVDYFASSAVAVDLLDDKNSWELFCNNVFGHQEQGGGGTGCPPQLQQVGEKIVKRCRGLPLAITVIGGLLAKSPTTREYWEQIAKDQSNSFLLEYSSGTNTDNNPLSILYTSYKHLPIHLKSCFLYLGLFPEDHQIDASQLILFWIAEGFIKPNRNKSLEEVAESCMKELIDRNLLLVGILTGNKKVGYYYVHDLVRVLMIQIAEKENFYCVQRDVSGRHHFVVDERRASFYPRESLTSTSEFPVSVCHPLIFCSRNGGPFKSRLQRVMVDTKNSAHFEEVNLRLIMQIRPKMNSPRYSLKFPSSILSFFWSLQTIRVSNYIEDDIVVPVEIWKMPQLRHIDIWKMHFPNPPTATATAAAAAAGDNKDVIILHNLQTLRRLKNLSLSEEVCKRIPNIKKLQTYSDLEKDNDENLCFQLHNLKKLQVLDINSYIEDPLQNLKLPNSLKELCLGGCGLAWSDLEMIISALPHLQSLILHKNAVVGAEWNMGVEVEFLSLKHLSIDFIRDLTTWIAEASNFPVLETLSLWGLGKLDEIPPGIGEIPTLEEIDVYLEDSNKSLTMSAIKILEEQQSLGNEDLQLRLDFYSMNEAQMWKEQIQELGITSKNLQIY